MKLKHKYDDKSLQMMQQLLVFATFFSSYDQREEAIELSKEQDFSEPQNQ